MLSDGGGAYSVQLLGNFPSQIEKCIYSPKLRHFKFI
uniref:Uncharacterized protein n=1 Tax=Anguilla anguilla TaxID=7936 RepID=A0A0E9TY13_ANGAN